MTQENKDLLLKYLCMALPYKVKIMFSSNGFRWDWEQTLNEIRQCEDGEYAINGWGIHGIKPYLRPMSSMTEKEATEYANCGNIIAVSNQNDYLIPNPKSINWLLEHHFDFMGLISKNLAIEVTKSNNPYKE